MSYRVEKSNNKIMFVMVSMAGGGAERVISVVANNMCQRGMEVAILMTAGSEVAYDLDSRIELYSAGGTSGGKISARIHRVMQMRNFMKSHRDYTVISFGPGTSFFAWLSMLGLGMEFYVSERNDPAACPTPRLRDVIYGRAKKVICQTQDALDMFPQNIRRKGAVIPNPVKSQLPEMHVRTVDNTTGDIVAVGRLQPQKNYELMIRAFADFTKYETNVEHRLHIYGKGEQLDTLKCLCEELHIGDRVFFEGFHEDVLECIRTADMYVLSSDYEGISNSLIEAMALGIPVISTDCPIGGSRMCIEDCVNGLLVSCGDIDAMSQAMYRYASDREFAINMGQEAYKIRDRYAEDVITTMWIKELDLVCP